MGIRSVLFLMAACVQLMPGMSVHAQFVTLEGKDFKLDGEDFYPVAANFSVNYLHPTSLEDPIDPDDLFFSMDDSWGLTGHYDCLGTAACGAELLEAFQKVAGMGFNTIRLVGDMVPMYAQTDPLTDERRFVVEVKRYPTTQFRRRLPLQGPAYTDGLSLRHFSMIRDILDIADDAGLKVILLTGGKSKEDPTTVPPTSYMYPAFDQRAVDDYADYLARLAEELAGHPALLAYDLYNEPHYNKMERQGWDGLGEDDEPWWRKEDICAFTTQWYDAIKANAPDHLVTLGGLGLEDLEAWDPAALKLDFYSLHTYPDAGYQNEQGSMDFAAMLQRHRGVLHWFGQVCPMPWIIGETGFSANQSPVLQWPRMHGTEAQQAAFAQASLEYTRAAGGSGWSWWVFQDFRWYNPFTATPNEARGNYFGLLRLGNGIVPWANKPAVDVVQNYVPAPMPQPPGNEPPNYYNPNNLPTVPWLTGTVEDQHGQPIKEVNARIWCKSLNTDPDEEDLETFHSTYTDAAGGFIFYQEPQTAGYGAPVYENLLVVGVGTDRVFYGTWFGTPIPNYATHMLEMHPFLFKGQLANKDIYSTTQEPVQHYHAWTDLTVEDVTVHAGPDTGASLVEVAARNSVHITGDFHAQAGSVVHIRIMETFPECDANAFKSLLVEPTAAWDLVQPERAVEPPRLELRFLPAEGDNVVRVFPNPFRDAVEVLMEGMEGPVTMEVLDGLGRVVHRGNAEGSRTVLSLSHLALGPYHLLVRQGQQLWSHTLIKQP
ncbi:MAG: cellulase family glycosylhydrolase [Flavobacteriales bacterium]|nr:cellulase family glycosylhydrolase [Flavobacteriales bacterium]